MESFEVKKAVIETLNALDERRVRHPPRMEFSKKLILGALIFIGLAYIASVLSWFLIGDWPREIAEFFVWPFIAGIVSYMGKAAYENRAKIQK